MRIKRIYQKLCRTVVLVLWFCLVAFYFANYLFLAFLNNMLETQILDKSFDKSRSTPEPQENLKHIALPSGYTPPCFIKNVQSISAINRANSDSCKKKIAELACRNHDVSNKTYKNMFPRYLPNRCPDATKINPIPEGKYLGKLLRTVTVIKLIR